MPRSPRQFSTTDIYHIIFRGNDKQNIFYDNQDRYIFLERLKESKLKFNYQIYSYCLMDNHIHIVIKIKEKFLSKAMQNLAMRYSIYFNKKFNRIGHLFQGRFYSKKIENLSYFLTVCKYIHRNPEKANIDKTEFYKWSSYAEYIGKESIVDKGILLHYFYDDIKLFKDYTLINDDNEQIYNLADFELIKKLSDDDVERIIKEKFKLNNPRDIVLLDSDKKDKIIKSLKEIKGSSLLQISRVLGVTQYYINKIWK